MQITLETLRRASTALFDQLEAHGHHAIDVRHDYYWDVDRVQRHNLDVEPDNLAMGQLSEDWFNLQEMVRDDSLCAAYGLTWLASVLREVGESLNERG